MTLSHMTRSHMTLRQVDEEPPSGLRELFFFIASLFIFWGGDFYSMFILLFISFL